MQRTTASTSLDARKRRQLMVDAQQQREELRVLHEGMAHCDGLFSWSKRDSPTGSVYSRILREIFYSPPRCLIKSARNAIKICDRAHCGCDQPGARRAGRHARARRCRCGLVPPPGQPGRAPEPGSRAGADDQDAGPGRPRPSQAKRQAQAARLRAAQEREERIRAALEQLPEVAAAKKRNGAQAEDARASTTDADARVMKMGDGGFRPAFNVQFATECEGQVIVGMDVVNAGSDMAQLAPMVEQVEQRLGRSPGEWLVDGGFPAHEQIDAVAGKTEVYAPVPEPRAKKDTKKDEPGNEVQPDKHAPKPDDSEAVAEWRARMASDEAKEIYKQRAATAECVNAQARNRGLLRMPVRGLSKVRSVVGLFVLAHNLMRMAVLAPQLIGWGTGPCAMAAQAA